MWAVAVLSVARCAANRQRQGHTRDEMPALSTTQLLKRRMQRLRVCCGVLTKSTGACIIPFLRNREESRLLSKA